LQSFIRDLQNADPPAPPPLHLFLKHLFNASHDLSFSLGPPGCSNQARSAISSVAMADVDIILCGD
jgi:hypothetical protein